MNKTNENQLSYQRYSKVRNDAGKTDYAVANETGIPKSTFSSWKNGLYMPKLEKLRKIAECLNVPLERLIA